MKADSHTEVAEGAEAGKALDKATNLILLALASFYSAVAFFLIKWLGFFYGCAATLGLLAIFFLLLAWHTMRTAKRKLLEASRKSEPSSILHPPSSSAGSV